MDGISHGRDGVGAGRGTPGPSRGRLRAPGLRAYPLGVMDCRVKGGGEPIRAVPHPSGREAPAGSAAADLCPPGSGGGRERLDRVGAGFAGPDPDGFLDRGNENLAVADASGLRRPPDRLDRRLDHVVAQHDLDLYLG